ncbi:E3 ubiquitin-protein ligase Topors [Drosophila takahashii]|uniref:E3 ubiquitin-protein ligase Topors n=1 Tax=Drosophila takahashii TaxID=29030 RepID=UPI0038992996
MLPRHMVNWRLYVYTNSLYSIPNEETSGYRDWSPQHFRRNPFEIHRIMNWVNRDISVVVKSGQTDVFYLYETILNLLTEVSIKSLDFGLAVVHYFGGKTHQFTHELMNFARSPYDDIIAYECNTLYRVLPGGEGGGPTTSSMARDQQFLSSKLHNFVEFSRSINYDDCGGFEADLALEDEDFEELDDLMVERFSRSHFDGEMSTARARPATLIPPASQQAGPANQPTQSQQAAQQPAQAQSSQQAAPRASQQASASTSGSHQASGLPLEDLELEVAIERSLFEGAAQGFVLPSGRLVRLSNTNRSLVRNTNSSGSGSGSGSVSGSGSRSGSGSGSAAAAGASPAAAQNPSTAVRGRRRRLPHSR